MQEKQNEKGKKDFSRFLTKRNIALAVGILILFNIVWTLTQGKVSSEAQALREELTKLEQRLAKLEEGGILDLESVRAEFEEMKKVGSLYSSSLEVVMKTETERLEALKKEVAMRQGWLEELNAMVSRDSGK
ncbi:MAG: hypothetical protein GX256_10635 [Fretibacterium sp.]|nr:hypothetical protein [Fretibacterium sp.]